METDLYNVILAAILVPTLTQLGAFLVSQITNYKQRANAKTKFDIQALEQQLAAQAQSLENEKRLNEITGALLKRSEKLDETVTTLRSELDTTKTELLSLHDQLEEKDAQIAGLTAKVERLTLDQIAAIRTAQEAHDKEIKTLQSQITELRAALAGKDKTIEARDATIEARDAEIVELIKRMGDMSIELNKLKQWKIDVEKREATPPPDLPASEPPTEKPAA